MNIEVRADPAALALRAADAICAAVRARPDAWLGLPTGNTPIPAYAKLDALVSAGSCDLSRATVCAIDEFCAPGPGPSPAPGTNAAFYAQHLHVSIRSLRCPDARASSPDTEIHRFAADIQKHGGLDFCVLGIGENGHIAFNEPGSPSDSRARVVDLADSTRRAHAEGFGGTANVPRQGMTLGIADLMQSKSLFVLATGAAKAAIVSAAIEGPITADVPASWLRQHGDVTWLLDGAAASALTTHRHT